MNSNLERLEAEILQLAPEDRSHLVERIIASLNRASEIEAAWDREADCREAILEAGAVGEVSGEEALNRLRSKLGR